MSQKRDFFFEALDMYLRDGIEPGVAIKRATDDYAYVYYHRDGRTPLARASSRVLDFIAEADKDGEKQDD